jgi:hypothetical protein
LTSSNIQEYTMTSARLLLVYICFAHRFGNLHTPTSQGNVWNVVSTFDFDESYTEPENVYFVCAHLMASADVVARSVPKCSFIIPNPKTSRARHASRSPSRSQSYTFHNQIRWKRRFIGWHQRTGAASTDCCRHRQEPQGRLKYQLVGWAVHIDVEKNQ